MMNAFLRMQTDVLEKINADSLALKQKHRASLVAQHDYIHNARE